MIPDTAWPLPYGHKRRRSLPLGSNPWSERPPRHHLGRHQWRWCWRHRRCLNRLRHWERCRLDFALGEPFVARSAQARACHVCRPKTTSSPAKWRSLGNTPAGTGGRIPSRQQLRRHHSGTPRIIRENWVVVVRDNPRRETPCLVYHHFVQGVFNDAELTE